MSFDSDTHILTASRPQSLSRQDMFHLTGANSKGKSTKSPMCRSVTVSTDNGTSWKCESLFRPDDMDDTLSTVVEAKVAQAKLLDIVFEGQTLDSRVCLFDKRLYAFEMLAGFCWDVLRSSLFINCARREEKNLTYVIYRGESTIWPANLAASVPQSLEGLLHGRHQ